MVLRVLTIAPGLHLVSKLGAWWSRRTLSQVSTAALPFVDPEVFSRYSQQYIVNPTTNSQPLIYGTSNTFPLYSGVLDYTHTFGPRLINDVRAGVSYYPADANTVSGGSSGTAGLINGQPTPYLPALTFAIFLAAIVGPSELNIILILGLVYWTRYARVIRGEVLSLKQREFVRLAIVAGCSKSLIMWRHILPNVINSAVVLATLMLGVVIVTEASLSFLGVGVPPPKPAWGLMMADGKKGLMVGYWWLTVFPGVCIMLMVLSANLLGDWLRVKLDPQLRQL